MSRFAWVFLALCSSPALSWSPLTHQSLALYAIERLPTQEKKLAMPHVQEIINGMAYPDVVLHDYRNHIVDVDAGSFTGRDHLLQLLASLMDGATSNTYIVHERRAPVSFWFALGVAGHYLTDLHQPLHTGRSPEEHSVHSKLETWVNKQYGHLISIPWSPPARRAVTAETVAEFVNTFIMDSARSYRAFLAWKVNAPDVVPFLHSAGSDLAVIWTAILTTPPHRRTRP